MEAIILAGGFGTRLKNVINNVPKPMARVNDKPFLEYILDYLIKNNITRIILSVGYKYKEIQDHFGTHYDGCEIAYSIEETPLGTGGAISKSLQLARSKNIFVLNGDTFFNIDLAYLFDFHNKSNSLLTLSLKYMKNFDRYGSVKTDNNGVILNFNEKSFVNEGKINAGLYVINKDLFNKYDLPPKFSFETFMEEHFTSINYNSLTFKEYFIDIGIPEDYHKVQNDFKKIFLSS